MSHGLGVERRYLDPRTGEQLTQLRPGQLVKVRLTVRAEGTLRHYVALVDPLPAGLEPVNTKLATAHKDQPAPEPSRPWAWSRPRARPLWNHTELRDDRVLAFANALHPGAEHVFEYLARATLRGQFDAAPAHVEQMYRPEHYGRSRQQLVVVSERARPKAHAARETGR